MDIFLFCLLIENKCFFLFACIQEKMIHIFVCLFVQLEEFFCWSIEHFFDCIMQIWWKERERKWWKRNNDENDRWTSWVRVCMFVCPFYSFSLKDFNNNKHRSIYRLCVNIINDHYSFLIIDFWSIIDFFSDWIIIIE